MDQLSKQKLLEKKDRFQLLFEEGKRRIENLQAKRRLSSSHECTFKPNMSLTRSFNGGDLNNFRKSYNGGRRTCNPEIIRNSSLDLKKSGGIRPSKKIARGSKGNSPISPKKEIGKKKAVRIKLADKGVENSSSTMVKTDQMYISMKIDCFNNIFSAIDSKGNGTINQGKFNKDVFLILKPVFSKIVKEGETLNKEKFIKALNNYFEELTEPEKNIILTKSKEKTKEERDIGRIKNIPEMDLHEKQTDLKKFSEKEIIETKNLKKEEMEMKGCSFQPKFSNIKKVDNTSISHSPIK